MNVRSPLTRLAAGFFFALLATTAHAQPADAPLGDATAPAASAAVPATPAVAVATEFYNAFVAKDTATMETLYAPDVKWKDTIFSYDDRNGTMGMWRIELDPTNPAKFTYSIASAQGDTVVVHWLADYSLFGRPIHNNVMSTLTVKNGLIVQETDDYSWQKWAAQAFPFGSLSNDWPLKPVLMGVLRTAMDAEIALYPFTHMGSSSTPSTPPPPSKTSGLEGALGAATAAH